MVEKLIYMEEVWDFERGRINVGHISRPDWEPKCQR